MQNEANIHASPLSEDERSKLEDRIIAHFDGSMDASSSKSLMDEVMATPEKRALFRAHETLARVIASARVPMEAPLETRREIAEKIPGLIAFIPGLIGTAATAPVIQQSLNPILAFFSRMSLTTAVSIGSAVAVLTTVGIIASNNSGTNNPGANNIGANSGNVAPKTVQTQSAAPSSSASQNYAMVPSATKAARNNSGANSSGTNNYGTNSSRHISSIARNAKPVNPTSVNNIYDNSDIQASNASSVNASSVKASSVQDNAASSEPITPVIANQFTEPKSAAPIAAAMPQQKQIMTELPAEYSEGITVRPYASYGYSGVLLNGINAHNQLVYENTKIFGAEFDLADRWMARVQGGTSPFAEITPVIDRNAKSIASLIGPPTVVYGPGMIANERWWATVGMSYSFQTPIAPIIVGGDLGAAFTSPNTSFLGMASIGTELSLATHLAIEPTVSINMLGTSTNVSNLPNGLWEGVNATTMWATSFGFQLNFVYRP